jgi:hypothetical protein
VQVLAAVSGPAMVGPMTTKVGLGKSHNRGKAQCLEKVFPQVPQDLLDQLPDSTPTIQSYVAAHAVEPYVRASWLLGARSGGG